MKPLDPGDLRLAETVHDSILRSCRNCPDRTALAGHGGDGPNYSYGVLEETVLRLAAGLQERIGGIGSRVGIISGNCPEWALVYLAGMAAGSIVVPLDAALKATELVNFLRVSGIKLIFCSRQWSGPVREIVSLNDPGLEVVVLDDDAESGWRGLLRPVSEYRKPEVKGDDTAVLIYTSGTTGDPKGVVLTHGNLMANLASISGALEMYADDVFLSVLPMHHTFEATCGFLFPLLLGLKIVYVRSLKSRDIIEGIRDNRVTCMIGVPILFEKMYNSINRGIRQQPFYKVALVKIMHETSRAAWAVGLKSGKRLFRGLFKKAGLSSLRLLVSGGAPLPSFIAEWFNLAGIDFLVGYGLTECAPVVTVNRPDDIRFDSVGPALPGVALKIDDPDRGIGEILVRGKNNTPGYLDNPEATGELLREGWLCTGDLGRIERGHLYITGRRKNLIVTGGGKNVYPEEIESLLNLSDSILESLVIGRKNNQKTGEEIWAIIVPDREYISQQAATAAAASSPDELRKLIEGEIAAVNGRLSDYKRILHFEIRLEEFEKTSTRKIKRTLYQ